MNLAVTATVAGLALVTFVYFYWQKIWDKTQCWLLVLVGLGAAGLLGNMLNTLLAKAGDLTSLGSQFLLGVALPGAIMVWVLLGFTIEMLPDRVVSSRPVTWHTRICALLVPSAIAIIPSILTQIGDGASGLLSSIGG